METEIPWSQYIYQNTEFKGQLLNFYHKNGWAHPEYTLVRMNTINNKKVYIMGVKDNQGNVLEEGEGSTKKAAEQNASMKALYRFGVITKDQMIEI